MAPGRRGDDWERLAAHVLARRVDMGHSSHESFARVTGFGARTLGDLERGERTSYAPATLARLERALCWTPGSARAVLAGDEPRLLAAVTDLSEPGEDVEAMSLDAIMAELTPAQQEMVRGLAVGLLQLQRSR